MLAFYDVWVQDLKFACEYLQALKAKGLLEVIREVTLFIRNTASATTRTIACGGIA